MHGLPAPGGVRSDVVRPIGDNDSRISRQIILEIRGTVAPIPPGDETLPIVLFQLFGARDPMHAVPAAAVRIDAAPGPPGDAVALAAHKQRNQAIKPTLIAQGVESLRGCRERSPLAVKCAAP